MASLHKFYALLLLYLTGEVSGVQLEPLNAFVLQGSKARFNCSLEGDFEVMGWLINGRLAITISMQSGVLGNSQRFSATNFSSGTTQRWEFIIQEVQRNDSGAVSCDVQNIQTVVAQMSVQESGTVAIVGTNVTVTEGSLAELWCVAPGWFPAPELSWAKNGSVVDRSLYNSSSELQGSMFNATSVLRIRGDVSAPVECRASIPALTAPLTSTIYMVVEAPVPAPTDWTVLIAVVVSIGGFALLVLLILGIVFCCKRRKKAKSSYEEEMRRARTQSQLSIVSGSRQKPGQVNLGYVADGQTTDIPPSDFNDSGYSQTNGSSTFVTHIPDILNSNQTSNVHMRATNTLDGNGIKNHRHATIV
ncbi:immunoglobulin superfamily member 5 isoform X1 [Hypomesus transpacificus]|uniref:immunoglobulin superfamily member 5 isoform X1 n=1 Tax=Hypomesus transpacificus TaxID=137520 RepID=UPI001F07BA3F|nr:immunoglobulin superfamily member 5 isoform X1 [Hypomesus transpacificus]XP_046876813.1 immunoglobulin superfamily member 5 isoform X1 [Hypomesus transpacificus]